MSTTAEVDLAGELRLTIGRLARRLRQNAGSGGLTPSQLSALSAVDNCGPVRLGDLAVRDGVSAPTMSRIVSGLEEAGLVARAADTADRRAARLSTTPAGRARLRKVRGERTAFLQRRLHELAPEDRQRLVEALPVLAALLGEGDQ